MLKKVLFYVNLALFSIVWQIKINNSSFVSINIDSNIILSIQTFRVLLTLGVNNSNWDFRTCSEQTTVRSMNKFWIDVSQDFLGQSVMDKKVISSLSITNDDGIIKSDLVQNCPYGQIWTFNGLFVQKVFNVQIVQRRLWTKLIVTGRKNIWCDKIYSKHVRN